MTLDSLDVVAQCVVGTCSLSDLTSAEEYPDDEYLDTSKSSSLGNKQTDKGLTQTSRAKPNKREERTVAYLSVSRATNGFSSGLWSKEE